MRETRSTTNSRHVMVYKREILMIKRYLIAAWFGKKEVKMPRISRLREIPVTGRQLKYGFSLK